MRIVNAMFSQGSGGIEQCVVDYCEALLHSGHKVSALIHPKSVIKEQLLGIDNLNILGVKNCGQYDFFAKSYIKKILKQINADIVIAHGNRAVSLLKSPCKNLGIKLIGVSHNYKIKRLIGLDGILTITNDLKKTAIKAGHPEDKTFLMPNMIRLQEVEPKLFSKYNNPPIIGTMGRFVKKKGFAEFLQALAVLVKRKVEFKAVIGGDGEEFSSLKQLRAQLDLEKHVDFSGWVSNKSDFFNNIDIFCLPSLHEPFGIILLEAFAAKKPVISFKSEGPSEIITDNKDALMAKIGDAEELADKLEMLIKSEKTAKELAKNAYSSVKKYDLKSAAKRLDEFLCL